MIVADLLGIGDLIDKFVCFVQTGVILVVNQVIAGLGALATATIGLLPSMPNQPAIPGAVNTAFAFARWAVPWDFIVTVFEADAAIFAAWFALAALLRWVKVVE